MLSLKGNDSQILVGTASWEFVLISVFGGKGLEQQFPDTAEKM